MSLSSWAYTQCGIYIEVRDYMYFVRLCVQLGEVWLFASLKIKDNSTVSVGIEQNSMGIGYKSATKLSRRIHFESVTLMDNFLHLGSSSSNFMPQNNVRRFVFFSRHHFKQKQKKIFKEMEQTLRIHYEIKNAIDSYVMTNFPNANNLYYTIERFGIRVEIRDKKMKPLPGTDYIIGEVWYDYETEQPEVTKTFEDIKKDSDEMAAFWEQYDRDHQEERLHEELWP